MNPYKNMMLGIAIGDAWGAGFEFRYETLAEYQAIELGPYQQNPNPDFKHKIGMYTDDTQMSIAVAEAVALNVKVTPKILAGQFVKQYKIDNVVGYAKGFDAFLKSINSAQEFLDKIRPDSERNGAAMRAVPIGMIQDVKELVEVAKINASLTHNNPKGIASSIVVALISHYNLYHKRMPNFQTEVFPHIIPICVETVNYLGWVSRMEHFSPKLLFGPFREDKGVPCDGMRTAGAVWYILSNYKKPADILLESVRLGGDTDSVASIALGIGLMHNPISSLPPFLYNDLTNHKYGRDYLEDLGGTLQFLYSESCCKNKK